MDEHDCYKCYWRWVGVEMSMKLWPPEVCKTCDKEVKSNFRQVTDDEKINRGGTSDRDSGEAGLFNGGWRGRGGETASDKYGR